VSAGLRHNRWSGAYAVQLTQGALAQWNNPFNVDWNGADANGVRNPGYAAQSTDVMVGVRKYISPKLVGHLGVARLGKASTDNPSERGQRQLGAVCQPGRALRRGPGPQRVGVGQHGVTTTTGAWRR
jgi:hypothetical protein